MLKFLILCVAVAALALLVFLDFGASEATLRGTVFPVLAGVLTAVLGVRVALWFTYRPMQLTTQERSRLPSLTVVIPAYNEGGRVRRAIETVLASAYPADRLAVTVVNDGSTDDTGAHIDGAAASHPGRVRVIHLPRNGGKRQAVYEGFRLAQSEVIATVDSDSRVPPKSLANLVAPLLRDPRVGGVAGKVLVDNRGETVITRMLGVRYILGFDFVRAYQSQLHTVWCCPGALQAYRRSAVEAHLSRWRDQRFLGAQCTNGDDHAMTNLVLSLGYDTRYQANAPVLTVVPARYRKLCRMFTRWGRSATREGLRALRFTPRRCWQKGPWRGPLIALDALLQPVTIAAKIVGLAGALAVLASHPLWFVQGGLATTAVALLYGAIYLRSEWSTEAAYGVLYAWFAFFGLFWVQPWATMTVRGNKWLTR